ncbi:MAG: type II toxin-antitoxin system VapC family toxin [Alphaproteobacteria bacterium]
MRYLLDTDTCSTIIRTKPLSVLEKLQSVPMNDVVVSVMTVAELRYGLEKLGAPRSMQRAVDEFLSYLNILPWCEAITSIYAKIRHDLHTQGMPMGAMDLMIAAHALQAGATLVTSNTQHFSKVKGLTLDNWIRP